MSRLRQAAAAAALLDAVSYKPLRAQQKVVYIISIAGLTSLANGTYFTVLKDRPTRTV
jgi:outer membrane protein assembly factor BamA